VSARLSQLPSRLALAALALGAFAAADARAVGFGPLLVVDPSVIENQDQSISVAPTGSLAVDVASVPFSTPQVFRITDVSITAGPLSFVLDPTLASPALGVIQPDGSFLIPTLFLRGSDGATAFDLAIPNLEGTAFGAPNGVTGLFTSFQVETADDVFDVILHVNVPEPTTALLLGLGLAALVGGRAREIAR
jgi:hypothetical protein